MKNLKLFLLGLMLCAALPSQAWDRTRHDAIAYIAECNLTPRAKRNIARYLDHSIVYYASWMDKYRDTPEFRNVEHVSYVDAGMQLVDTLRKGKTNCVVELMRAVDRLKDYRNMSDSLVRLNLMYVIHIVGDMHCPSHVKYAGCKSGRADLQDVSGVTVPLCRVGEVGLLQMGSLFLQSQQLLLHTAYGGCGALGLDGQGLPDLTGLLPAGGKIVQRTLAAQQLQPHAVPEFLTAQ